MAEHVGAHYHLEAAVDKRQALHRGDADRALALAARNACRITVKLETNEVRVGDGGGKAAEKAAGAAAGIEDQPGHKALTRERRQQIRVKATEPPHDLLGV